MFGIFAFVLIVRLLFNNVDECSGNQFSQILRELLSAPKQSIVSFQSFDYLYGHRLCRLENIVSCYLIHKSCEVFNLYFPFLAMVLPA